MMLTVSLLERPCLSSLHPTSQPPASSCPPSPHRSRTAGSEGRGTSCPPPPRSWLFGRSQVAETWAKIKVSASCPKNALSLQGPSPADFRGIKPPGTQQGSRKELWSLCCGGHFLLPEPSPSLLTRRSWSMGEAAYKLHLMVEELLASMPSKQTGAPTRAPICLPGPREGTCGLKLDVWAGICPLPNDKGSRDHLRLGAGAACSGNLYDQD